MVQGFSFEPTVQRAIVFPRCFSHHGRLRHRRRRRFDRHNPRTRPPLALSIPQHQSLLWKVERSNARAEGDPPQEGVRWGRCRLILQNTSRIPILQSCMCSPCLLRHIPLIARSTKWEVEAMRLTDPDFAFPDEDLGLALINLYFVHLNYLYPLLHRPTFERHVKERHHLRDHGFGSVYLLVCANGARYSDDPRIFLDGASAHSAGWKFFEQVPVIGKALLAPPTLEDLQVYCVRNDSAYSGLPFSSTNGSSYRPYTSRGLPLHRRAGRLSELVFESRRTSGHTGARSTIQS